MTLISFALYMLNWIIPLSIVVAVFTQSKILAWINLILTILLTLMLLLPLVPIVGISILFSLQMIMAIMAVVLLHIGTFQRRDK